VDTRNDWGFPVAPPVPTLSTSLLTLWASASGRRLSLSFGHGRRRVASTTRYVPSSSPISS